MEKTRLEKLQSDFLKLEKRKKKLESDLEETGYAFNKAYDALQEEKSRLLLKRHNLRIGGLIEINGEFFLLRGVADGRHPVISFKSSGGKWSQKSAVFAHYDWDRKITPTFKDYEDKL